MKRFLSSCIVSFALLLIGFIGQSSAHTVQGTVTVHMGERGFSPQKVQVTAGTRVVFENTGQKEHWPASNIHPTHDIYPEFDPQLGIAPGHLWQFTFKKEGRWRYHDHIYPNFTGEILVLPSPDGKKQSFWQSVIGKILSLFQRDNGQDKEEQYAYDPRIKRGEEAIFNDKNALFSHVKKFGAKQTVVQLASLSEKYGDCHQSAHAAGRFSFELEGNKAFQQCSAECHSGCYHGATEAYFKKNGTNDLQKSLNIICGTPENEFMGHQCFHGIGHGLMAWSDYELFESLKNCDLLVKSGQESCYSGVFMENVVGALAFDEAGVDLDSKDFHFTKYLNNDPEYPCTIVNEKYKSACYFFQTSRMVDLFDWDFTQVAQACLAVPERFQDLCFDSMGRDASGYTLSNAEESIKLCSNAPYGKYRVTCLRGAVQDFFWDQSGQDNALRFCKLLTDYNEKDGCYDQIVFRAPEVIRSAKDREAFCEKTEGKYVQLCKDYVKGVISLAN